MSPSTLRFVERLSRGLVVIILGLTFATMLRTIVGHFLEPDDPRRFLVGMALLYGMTFVVIALYLLLPR